MPMESARVWRAAVALGGFTILVSAIALISGGILGLVSYLGVRVDYALRMHAVDLSWIGAIGVAVGILEVGTLCKWSACCQGCNGCKEETVTFAMFTTAFAMRLSMIGGVLAGIPAASMPIGLRVALAIWLLQTISSCFVDAIVALRARRHGGALPAHADPARASA